MVTEAFKEGDVVHLKSGGPSMTVGKVTHVNDARGPVLDVVYFDASGRRKTDCFFAVLVEIGEGQGDPPKHPRTKAFKESELRLRFHNETERDRE